MTHLCSPSTIYWLSRSGSFPVGVSGCQTSECLSLGYYMLLYFFLFFFNSASLCRPGWLQPHGDLSASAFTGLGFKCNLPHPASSWLLREECLLDFGLSTLTLKRRSNLLGSRSSWDLRCNFSGKHSCWFIASQDEPKGGRMGSNLIHLVTLEERHETMPSRKNMVLWKQKPVHLHTKEFQELAAAPPAASHHRHLLIAESSLRQEAMWRDWPVPSWIV